MGKHVDSLKSLEEFRAPWETEGGGEAEIDKPALRRYIHGLQVDKARAQDARDDATTALAAAKSEAAKNSPEDVRGKIADLQKQVEDLTAAKASLEGELEVTKVRAEVLAGVDPRHAKYVNGTTKEELERSLADVLKDFGVDVEADGDDEDDTPTVRTRPRPLTSGVDPAGRAGRDGEIDYEAAAAQILGDSLF